MRDQNNLGKIPPQAVEVEQAVLGALMLESEAFEQIGHLMSKEAFYSPANGQIFETIKAMANSGKPIDLMTVTRELKERSLLEQVGGPLYITELTSLVSSAAHIEHHARIITEKYAQRDLIRICTEIQAKAYDTANDIDQLISDFQQAGNSLEKHFEGSDTGTPQLTVAKETLREIYSDVEKSRKGQTPGINTGFTELNEVLGGWRQTNLVIIAARPGVGKTSLALHFATKAAESGCWVNFFSLEMTKNQLFKIMLSGASDVNRTKIRDGYLNADELKRINHTTGQIENLPIIWNDRQINPNTLRGIIKRNYKAGRCNLVIIDYLQLITPTDKKAIREQQISEISRTLKGIALELQIPIICLSQLNREAEKEVPRLSHLRESGAIEQDADIVLFPYRPEPDKLKLIVAKSRHGRTGAIDIWANEQMTKFADNEPTECNYRENYNPDQSIEPTNNTPF